MGARKRVLNIFQFNEGDVALLSLLQSKTYLFHCNDALIFVELEMCVLCWAYQSV